MSEELSIRELRLQKLARMRELGHDPYMVEKFDRTDSAQGLLDNFAEEKQVAFAGRVVSYRLMGKAGFAHLSDGDGKIQIYCKKDELGEVGWELYNLLDIGDHVGVKGHLFITKTGEKSIHVSELIPLSKSLQVLPLGKTQEVKDEEGNVVGTKTWYELEDVEQRYRHRHLDLIVNPDARRTLLNRARIVSAVRRYFDQNGYLEVETPLLQVVAGGAAARPFKTHYNAYDLEVKLRISLELYLKRLICGDIPAVYEIGRVFRNEGVSNRHNPEFTLLEFYESYTNLEGMMKRVEELFAFVAKEVYGGYKVIPGIGGIFESNVGTYEQMTRFLGEDLYDSSVEEFSGKYTLVLRVDTDQDAPAGKKATLFESGNAIKSPNNAQSLQIEKGRILVYETGPGIRSVIEVLDTAVLTEECSSYNLFSTYEGPNEFTLDPGVYKVKWKIEGLLAVEASDRMSDALLNRKVFDFSQPWKRVNLLEEIERHTGLTATELSDLDAAKKAIVAKKVVDKAHEVGGHISLEKEDNLGGLIEKLLEVFVEPTLQEPTFVVGYPIETSPLAKKEPGNPRMTRRFEGYILGREICNAFSEINDPVDQMERFEQQASELAKGDDEAHPYDEEFLYALEGGMPPTGGCGIGMERLAMVLTGADHIREVMFFPMMKPKEE